MEKAKKKKTIRLKRCPFCGSKARIWFDHCGTNMYECNIECSNVELRHAYCVARGKFENAVERWNTRANDDSEDVFVEVKERQWITADEDKYRGGDCNNILGD